MKRLNILTNSRQECFRRCQREHDFMYVQGYRSVEDADALRFGSLWHLGLEVRRLRGLAQALEVVTAGAKDAFEAAKLRVLLTGYDVRWGDEVRTNSGELLEVVGVEETFYAPLVNPETSRMSQTYQLGGKLDLRLRDGFLESKTTSDDIGMGSVYWRVLTLNSQVSTYYAGAKVLGTEPLRCIYDVVRKPRLQPRQIALLDDSGYAIVLDQHGDRVYCKTAKKGELPKPRETGDSKLGYVLQTREETPEQYEARLLEDVSANPDAYFQRGEVVRLEAELREAAQDAWDLGQQMLEAARAGRAPRNPQACRRGSGVCWAFDVCTGVASLEDTSRFVKLEDVHPELSEHAQAAE